MAPATIERVKLGNKDSNYGQTALGWAALKGHEGVVRLLVTNEEATVQYGDTEYKLTTRSKAAQKGHMNIVQLPLYQGVGLNAPINSAANSSHL